MKYSYIYFVCFAAAVFNYATLAAPLSKAPLLVVEDEHDDATDTTHEDETAIVMTETPVEAFLHSDANADGKLDFEEYLHTEALFLKLKREQFNELDTNKDGFVSQDEYARHFADEMDRVEDQQDDYYAQLFKDFDVNADKRLNPTEVKKVLSKRFLLRPKSNFGDLFARFDADHDGGLDASEYRTFDATFPFEELEPTRVAIA